MRTLLCPLSILVAVAAWGATSVCAQSRYQVVDIAPLGDFSHAAAINDRGQIAGAYGFDTRPGGGFLVDPQLGFIDLAPRLTDSGNPLDSAASALNEQGMVTGYVSGAGGAFRYSLQTGFERIRPGVPGAPVPVIGNGINDAGQVVGQPGFLATPGQAALQPLPLDRASDINNAGVVAGIHHERNGQGDTLASRVAVFDGERITFLGTLGGRHDNGANGQTGEINDAGVVVGRTETVVDGATTAHAFRYTPGGGLLDLDTRGLGSDAGSGARGLNDQGQVVGWSWREMMAPTRAFLHDDRWGMLDLNDLLDPASVAAGWVLLGAADINNLGQIVGYGERDGMPRAFLLDPIATPVPEPDTLVMLAAGVALLGATRLRSRRAAVRTRGAATLPAG